MWRGIMLYGKFFLRKSIRFDKKEALVLITKDGIAYANDPDPILGVRHVQPLDGYKLLVSYSNGDKRITDISSLLGRPAFQPLKGKAVFDRICVEYGIPMWLDGEVDIAPEWLYEHGINPQ